MIPYSFHPDADTELAEAAFFYESRMRGLGKSFAAEVDRTISFEPPPVVLDTDLGKIRGTETRSQ